MQDPVRSTPCNHWYSAFFHFLHLQWNLRIADTLGTGLLSIVERSSLSLRSSLTLVVSQNTPHQMLFRQCHMLNAATAS